jgi:transcriptional regulator with XRE-family HTH domain
MNTKVIHSNDYYYDIVRKNIKYFRLLKKYTQQRLAEEADMSIDFLSEIESFRRKKSFSIATLGRIADVLEIPIEDFFKTEQKI